MITHKDKYVCVTQESDITDDMRTSGVTHPGWYYIDESQAFCGPFSTFNECDEAYRSEYGKTQR